MRRFRLRRTSGNAQAAQGLQERGTRATKFGYTQFPWNIHPDDQYIRVVPNGPFDQAWQGVQKDTYVCRVGTKRASTYSPVPRYLQQLVMSTPRVQYDNIAATAFGAGPAAITAMTQQYQETGQPTSFKAMVMDRLLGRS